MADGKYKLPINLFILDTIGVALAGLGLFEWLSGSSVVPDQFKFENYHIAMVVVGVVLMAPVTIHFINRALGARKGG